MVLADVSWTPQSRNEGTKNGTTNPPKSGTRERYKNRMDGTKNRNEGIFAKTTLIQNRPFVSLKNFHLNNHKGGDKGVRVWIRIRCVSKPEKDP